MNSSIGRLRLRVLLFAGAGFLTAMLLIASQASAGTLYACVKKGGSAHIFSKKPKCKRGESKLSWNTVGPAGRNGSPGAGGKEGAAGKNGTNGTAGTNGLNGAVAGFGAFQSEALNITNAFEIQPVPGLSKKLPAGSFIAAASVGIVALSKNANEDVSAVCVLRDTPEKGAATEVEGKWVSATTSLVIFIFTIHPAQSVIALDESFSTTTPSTLSVFCGEQGRAEEVNSIEAVNGSLVAVQTSALS